MASQCFSAFFPQMEILGGQDMSCDAWCILLVPRLDRKACPIYLEPSTWMVLVSSVAAGIQWMKCSVDFATPCGTRGSCHILLSTSDIGLVLDCFEPWRLHLFGGCRSGWRVRFPSFSVGICHALGCQSWSLLLPQGYEFIEGLLLLGCTDPLSTCVCVSKSE